MLLGATVKAVLHRRAALGIKPCAKQLWQARLGQASSTRLRKRGGSHGIYTAEEEKLLGTLSDGDLARRLGRTTLAVQARRIQLKIPKFDARFHQWTAEEDALLGTQTDGQLASRLGLSVLSVAHRRRRLGVSVQFAHRRPWTPAEDALLGTASDTEIAARLGRHLATVCIRRQKLGIPNLYWQQRAGRQRRRPGQRRKARGNKAN